MNASSGDGRKLAENYRRFLDMIGEPDGTLPPYDLDHIVARHQFRQEQVKLLPASSAVHMLIEADRHIDALLDQLLALMSRDIQETPPG